MDAPICSICQGPIPAKGTWTKGCNALPVNNGRCCDDCDWTIVIPARIRMYARQGALWSRAKMEHPANIETKMLHGKTQTMGIVTEKKGE